MEDELALADLNQVIVLEENLSINALLGNIRV